MSDFDPCSTEECKKRCDSHGAYCEDICINEIERLREYLITIRDTGMSAAEAAEHAEAALRDAV